jgi:hypothetical protein
VTNSSNTDTRCGEKTAHTLRLIALSLDETMLAPEMPWVSQRGGENFVFLSTFFKGQCFRLQGVIEAGADFVGFAILVQSDQLLFCFWGLRAEFL